MKFDISNTYTDPELNGSKGTYRALSQINIIGFNTDRAAVSAFLAEYESSPATHRVYKKECERLLLYAMLYIKKPLSSMNRDDFNDYVSFMKDPDPQWCGIKASKDSGNWRPFVGPMRKSGLSSAIAGMNSLMSWLVNAGYLSGNPLGLIRDKKAMKSTANAYKKVERFLDDDMWSSLLDAVQTMPSESVAEKYQMERMRFMLSFFSLLGARVSELCNAKMVDFQSNVGGWFWEVTGKGSKDANVAMPKDMVDALMRWRRFLGLSALPKHTETMNAIPFVNKNYQPLFTKDGIKPRRVNQILKEFFEMAAISLDKGGQEDKAEKMRLASAHWLRHTSITQKVNAGIDRRLVQIEARHSDAKTTGMYTHDEEKLRSDEAQKHKIKWNNPNDSIPKLTF